MAAQVIPPFGTVDSTLNHLGLSNTQHQRQNTRQQLQQDLQLFLQQQGAKNPRLRHSRQYHDDPVPPPRSVSPLQRPPPMNTTAYSPNPSVLPPIPSNYPTITRPIPPSVYPSPSSLGWDPRQPPLSYPSSAPNYPSFPYPPSSYWPPMNSMSGINMSGMNPHMNSMNMNPMMSMNNMNPSWPTSNSWPSMAPHSYPTPSNPMPPTYSTYSTPVPSHTPHAPPRPPNPSSNQYGDELRQQMEQDQLKKQQEKNERRQGPSSYSSSQSFTAPPSAPGYSNPGTSRDNMSSIRTLPSNNNNNNSKQNYMKELEQQIQEKKMEKERLKAIQLQEDLKKQRELEQTWTPSQPMARPLEQSYAGRRTRPQIQAMQQGPTPSMETPSQPAYTPDHYLDALSQVRMGHNATDTFASQGLPPMLNFLQSGSVQQPSLLSHSLAPSGLSSSVPAHAMMPTAPPAAPGAKSFARGQANMDSMPQWQKEDMLRKQKAQQETQNILRQQIAEKEAEKARKEAQRKLEEEREQQRIQREQDMLREKYQREVQEQKKKEEQARLENEKMKLDKDSKQKEEQDSKMQKAIQDAQEQAKKDKEKARQDRLQSSGQDIRATSNDAPVPFRSSSPPIPTLRNKQSVPPEQPAHQPSSTLQQRPLSPPIHAEYAPAIPSIPTQQPTLRIHSPPPPQKPVKPLLNPDTQAVLRQLSEIQRDLDLENQKLQIELSRPPLEPFRTSMKKPDDKRLLPTLETLRQSHPVSTRVSMEYKKTSHLPAQHHLVRTSVNDFPVHQRKKTETFGSRLEPSTSPVLERQRQVIQKQEEELQLLRRVQPHDSKKKKLVQHGIVTNQEKTLQHFLHSQESKSDQDLFSSEKVRQEMQEKREPTTSRPTSASKIFPFFDDMSRPKSSRGLLNSLGGPLGRRKSQSKVQLVELSVSRKRADSASTLNVDAIALRNEERLKTLGDLTTSQDKKPGMKMSESNIILAFLQKEAKLNNSLHVQPTPGAELPSVTSWKEMSLGRSGVDVFPH